VKILINVKTVGENMKTGNTVGENMKTVVFSEVVQVPCSQTPEIERTGHHRKSMKCGSKLHIARTFPTAAETPGTTNCESSFWNEKATRYYNSQLLHKYPYSLPHFLTHTIQDIL